MKRHQQKPKIYHKKRKSQLVPICQKQIFFGIGKLPNFSIWQYSFAVICNGVCINHFP